MNDMTGASATRNPTGQLWCRTASRCMRFSASLTSNAAVLKVSVTDHVGSRFIDDGHAGEHGAGFRGGQGESRWRLGRNLGPI